ncbi:MAG TPA: deoxyribose-phosphate aldolase [Clostridiales bacterium]|nr:deoxyribose-phosphate aldolase [Clostridiales bacterium]
MELDRILSIVDHTLLAQDASWDNIKSVCDDGIKYNVASVCIPPGFVKDAAAYVGGRIPICTVVGFPNGYSTTAAKCYETEDAIKNGADEIDMVINIGWLKDKKYDQLENEIRKIKSICGDRILKVIIETCLLTEQEKIRMCKIVSNSRADFIKTSTGFSKGGATREDVALFAKHIEPHLKIKAAGGIASLEDAEDFIRLGASRLGTSRIIKIVKGLEMEKDKY